MRILSLYIIVIIIIGGCRNESDDVSLADLIVRETESGNLSRAMHLADSLKDLSKDSEVLFMKADSLYEIAYRLKLDFSSSPEETLSSIEKRLGPVIPEQVAEWENKGWLEGRLIDGSKKYFTRAASNLALLVNFHDPEYKIIDDKETTARKTHTDEVLRSSNGTGQPVEPKKIKITYTLTVEKDAVPAGETIRCWLPWPKSGHPRQNGITLLSTSQPDYLLAPDTCVHSTIYMEKKAEKGMYTVFSIEYEYESSAQWFDPDSIKTLPHDKYSENFRKYTAEELPHINFSEDIRRLTDSICGDEKDAVENVFTIWRWFKENIPWTGAIEYSVLPDITAYACTNRRGDCGIQTMMFMSMLRYRGIPVRWQSGWKVPPFGKNLHDWCEVYFEGTGWVPVDISYDLQISDNMKLREYFMSGIDSYRLIVNDGIAGRLFPDKEYLRSEPYDFQRGEVEWKGGNLYFDKWDYEMKIEFK